MDESREYILQQIAACKDDAKQARELAAQARRNLSYWQTRLEDAPAEAKAGAN